MKVTYMVYDTIRKLIGQADDAIREQRYDDLMEFYTDDAVLVVRPGKEAHGKDEIKMAFMAIAGYFNGYVSPRQGNMVMLEAGDTVLVLSGETKEADLAGSAVQPTFVLGSVADYLSILQE